MKRIEKEIKSYKTVYVANDGTEFSNPDECKKYDESAKGVIMAKYKKLVAHTTNEWELFRCGRDDHRLDIVKPTCDRDKDIICQMALFVNHEIQDSWEEYLDKAIKDDDVVFVNWNCDEDWVWCAGTIKSTTERMTKFVHDFATKDDVEQK